MTQNICHFVPFHKDSHSISVINFVLETKVQSGDRLRSESVYKMYFVRSGDGALHTCGKSVSLVMGDIFFTFPGTPFAIESKHDLNYMYISFVGLRGNAIMEELKINSKNCLFHNAQDIQHMWEEGISANAKVVDLISEAVLLYTFAYLGDLYLPDIKQTERSSAVYHIKKYIDDNYTDHSFSLDKISRELSYNKKYISYIFKKRFGVGIIEYLNTVRIQNACTLMKQGFTGIHDIADQCGYSDAPYFSKLFKTTMGISPSDYIKGLTDSAT